MDMSSKHRIPDYTDSSSTINIEASAMDPASYPPSQIRNVCILAHVDHGKTCIADCLLTLNGMVNKRCTGKTKYLDDRPDEQERKITMKSSAVSICHTVIDNQGAPVSQLMNLVDTPGHIDFSTEVTSAVRICDGALCVVDVVEGILPQTKIALKQAYDEQLKMILVINKIDRLIIDLQLEASDMFNKIWHVVQDCNDYITALMRSDITTHVQDSDDHHIETPFNPVLGNVIFCSAIDGWGFTLEQIAEMYLPLLQEETLETLTQKLWELDLFVSSKDKCIKSGAVERRMPNVFCQLICSMLIHIYNTLVVNEDNDGISKILDKLKIDKASIPLKFYSFKMKLKLIMEKWKPLGDTIAQQCHRLLPSPAQMDLTRIHYLINYDRYIYCSLISDILSNCVGAIRSCSSDEPLIAYVTKLVVENKHRAPVLSGYENRSSLGISVEELATSMDKIALQCEGMQVTALVRVYSGRIHSGQRVTALSSEYNPIDFKLTHETTFNKYASQVDRFCIKDVFILMGSETKRVESVSAGYICGITCTDSFPFSVCTLSDSENVLPIVQQHRMEPIMYNVITPVEPQQSDLLRSGLQLLQKFDTCLKTFINDMGEYVISTAGSVHLEKCLVDLKKNFTDISIDVSEPIYSLRETVTECLTPPICKVINLSSSCNITLKMSVVPLPFNIVKAIRSHHTVLNMIQNQQMPSIADICARASQNALRNSTNKIFSADFHKNVIVNLRSIIDGAIRENEDIWDTLDIMKIMRISDSESNINILFNAVPDYQCNVFLTLDEFDPRIYLYNYLTSAFNLAGDIGPICKEPVTECAFFLNELEIVGDIQNVIGSDPHVGNSVLQQIRALFHDVILKQKIGIMEPMLVAMIQIETANIGGIYGEINRHFGKILPYVELKEVQKHSFIKAFIPAIDSDRFVESVRKISSGTASVNLNFYQYQIVTGEATDDEEQSTQTSKYGFLSSRAEKLVRQVRFRKGMPIYDQVVIHAEKQRTLKK